MRKDKLQSARYEFKYLVSEPKARQVRELVLHHLEPDDFTWGNEGLGYPVHSLYLDSHDFKTCVATQHGEKNRFKLRLRFYDDPKGPIFFEIKRRVDLVILKQRAEVARRHVAALLEGAAADRSFLLDPDNDRQFKALYNFCELRDRLHARPAAYTSYMREGYEKQGTNAVRVTFDRRLRAGTYRGVLGVDDVEEWSLLEMGGVVLELKFTDRFPEWMLTLVQMFNLTRRGFAKYVKCVSQVHGLFNTK